MKILVTGGAGYIGAHAVYALIEQNYEVVVIDNFTTGHRSNLHPKAQYYQVDLRDEAALKQVFTNEPDIKAIMHFAGAIVVSESVQQPLDYFDNNLCGVKTLLAVANQFQIQHLVFSSTAAVYGEPRSIPIREEDATQPINPYGASKLAAEWLIQAWAKAHGGHYVIFRYFNVAGAHASGQIGIKSHKLTHLVPAVLQAALTNSTVQIFGSDYPTQDGSCIRDFIHVDDLVQAHILGLQWTIKHNQSNTFNLGSGRGYSVLEVCQTVEKVLQTKLARQLNPRRAGDPAVLLADTTRVTTVLNWKPRADLAQIIHSEYQFRQQLLKTRR